MILFQCDDCGRTKAPSEAHVWSTGYEINVRVPLNRTGGWLLSNLEFVCPRCLRERAVEAEKRGAT